MILVLCVALFPVFLSPFLSPSVYMYVCLCDLFFVDFDRWISAPLVLYDLVVFIALGFVNKKQNSWPNCDKNNVCGLGRPMEEKEKMCTRVLDLDKNSDYIFDWTINN